MRLRSDNRIENISKSVTKAAKKRTLEAMNVSADDYITTAEFMGLLGNRSDFEALRRENKIPFEPLDTPSGCPKLWDRVKAVTFARRLEVLNEKAPAGGSVEEALTALGRALIREIREAISDEIAIQAQRYQVLAPESSRPEAKSEQGALMSRKEVGAMLGCSGQTIGRYEKNVADWPVPIRLGTRIRYSRAAIEEFLMRERLKSAPLPDEPEKKREPGRSR
ncbi:hypothetical protein P0D88_31535 [Paraburkholderia sp. RL18-103-BIB-C]|uniref:helix-turn-helix transcriptional regulator n=1 Tax=Paraburkholderia sp. RL18-103-BIB-C TaxID=3031637 RepID=UPI0038B7C6B5